MNKSKQLALQNKDLSLSALAVILIDEYGTEALNWDLETVKMELETDTRMEIPEEVITRIGCLQQIMTTDSFYQSLPDFITLCSIASGSLDSTSFWKPADAYDITAVMAEARLLNPPEGDIREILNPEILAYIEIALREFGILIPPDCLKFIHTDSLAVNDLATIQEDPILFSAGYREAQSASDDLAVFEDRILQKIRAEIMALDLETGDSTGVLRNER